MRFGEIGAAADGGILLQALFQLALLRFELFPLGRAFRLRFRAPRLLSRRPFELFELRFRVAGSIQTGALSRELGPQGGLFLGGLRDRSRRLAEQLHGGRAPHSLLLALRPRFERGATAPALLATLL